MPYIWEQENWPNLTWNAERLSPLLARASREQGRLLGKMEGLGFDLRSEAHLCTLTDDVMKSSEIEGENLPHNQVRSSIARRLGMDISGLVPSSRDVEGVVEMMTDATQNYATKLDRDRLFAWHAALFPTGRSGMRKIDVGTWRKHAMEVVSGPIGKEKVHYEAPPADRLDKEMNTFLKWFEKPSEMDPLLATGLAHFWFVTIHPFDDGNGRIARAVADMSLARAEQSPQRFYSMSAQILSEPDCAQAAYERVAAHFEMPEGSRAFAKELVVSVSQNQTSLDELIAGHARNWRVSRMAAVDRNVLRLAAFELVHTETPIGVVLDEAVELARRFGSEKSPAFVNGILNALAHAVRTDAP